MKFTIAAVACLFSATMAHYTNLQIYNLKLNVDEIETYLGDTYDQRVIGTTLTDDIKHECNNAVEDSKPEIKDLTLEHMARTMLDAFGDKNELAVDMFHWMPTIVYD